MPDTKCLIIGANGMLGRELKRGGLRRSIALDASERRADVDLAVTETVRSALERSRPQIVINASGYTDVDGAETDPTSANLVNHIGVGRLAELCVQHGVKLVHFSTDYVFDGTAREPYAVDAATNPINEYGRSKLAGEEAIRKSGADHLIIRTSWLFAPHGRNFLLTMLGLMSERDELRVVSDQVGRPTDCRDLASMTFDLVEHGASGTVHACNGGVCSWYEFALEIRAAGGFDCRIDPCMTADFPRPAPRPAYSLLDLSRMTGLIGPPRPWQEAVHDCVREVGSAG